MRPLVIAAAALLVQYPCTASAAGRSVANGGWTDVTSGQLAEPGAGYGVSWGDYDGDGDPDLCLAQYFSHPALRLFRNDGAGAFVDVTAGPLTSNDVTLTAVWGDADNDGDLDLFRVHFFEPRNVVYRNTGGTFSSAAALSTKGGMGGAAWGDADRDGDLDLVFVKHTGIAALYRNAGDLTFLEGPSLGEALRPTWVDYDGDGDLDLHLLAHHFDELLRNEGGTFLDAMPGVFPDNDDRSAAAWGDYDNDGDPDLYLGMASGRNRLLRNDGGGTFANATASTPLGLSGDSRDASWVDVDNDGDLDLFVVRATSANVLFLSDGQGGFVSGGGSALDGAGARQSAAWADYDGDGDQDVVVTSNAITGRLIRNDLSPGVGSWLQVDLNGTVSNRSGIGARIRVKSNGVWRIQDVSGGTGFSQGALTAHFGLGGSLTADSVEVRWPSGGTQSLVDVAADQRITISESEATGVPESGASPHAQLLPPAPNPSRVSTVLRFELTTAQRVHLDICDLAGRRVRLIVDQPMTAGPHTVSWDGRDANGAAAPAGVYWVRFEAGPIRQSQRFVRLR